MDPLCSLWAGILFFLAYVPYTWSLVRGKIQPTKSSWVIWWLMDILSLIGMSIKHTANGQIVAAVICGALVLVLILKYGNRGWGTLDVASIIIAGIGMIFWIFTKNANSAIIAGQLVILVGAIPTIASVWERPQDENILAWMLWTVSCVVLTTGISRWTIANALQPIAFLIADGSIMIALTTKRIKIRRP